MTLKDARKDQDYLVIALNLEEATKMRLQALGMTTGTRLRILNKKRNSAVIFMVRGTRLAVGEPIAAAIQIKEVQ